jgi:hypothetical protein
VKTLQAVSLGEILTQWGASERNIAMPTKAQEILTTLTHCLISRSPLIAQVLLAGVVEQHEVTLEPGDIDRLYAMVDQGDPPRSLRQHVTLAAVPPQQALVSPPFIGTARGLNGEITLFDGMHRADAWARQVLAGNGYDVRGAVFVTRVPAPFEGATSAGLWPTY